MPYSFYNDPEYKRKQSERTRLNWKKGLHNSLISALVDRKCKNKSCHNTFLVKPYDQKVFCSKNCAAHVNNTGRIQSSITRQRISRSVKLSPTHYFPERKIRIQLICKSCGKSFTRVPYLAKRQKYCSVRCAISVTGRLTTSPKASKGKNGIRLDIDPNINFYSTWEANVARVYNLVGLKWKYAPKLFELGEHTYRPDFYLSGFDTYVEIKNYMSEYSKMRDKMFRKKFSDIKLDLILKESYLEIKSNYKDLVEGWEN